MSDEIERWKEKNRYYEALRSREDREYREQIGCLGLWSSTDRSNGYNPRCNCKDCKSAKADYWGGR